MNIVSWEIDPVSGKKIREEVVSIVLGAVYEDTVRALSQKFKNMKAVQWVGILLLIAGPVVGFKMGWLTNGLIAGGIGLGMIVLAQILPGNERYAWFALVGLGLIPIVAFAWYKGSGPGASDFSDSIDVMSPMSLTDRWVRESTASVWLNTGHNRT